MRRCNLPTFEHIQWRIELVWCVLLQGPTIFHIDMITMFINVDFETEDITYCLNKLHETATLRVPSIFRFLSLSRFTYI